MEIKFGEYKIRSYENSDIDALIKYANNVNVSRWLMNTFPFPYTTDEAVIWLANCAAQDPETNFAIADDKELIGAIGLKLFDDVFIHNAEIGYWLGEPFWGKKIITNAVKEMTKFGFNNFNLNRIFANVFEGNPASASVLENCGYSLEGILKKAVFKKGKFLDQYIYAILKEEFIKQYE
ncbi:MAG TPA: GNAT family protein [Ignavibacteriaceae bacterium]|nr:GNAT family protein [Ignavibacteriaceae bacterium]